MPKKQFQPLVRCVCNAERSAIRKGLVDNSTLHLPLATKSDFWGSQRLRVNQALSRWLVIIPVIDIYQA